MYFADEITLIGYDSEQDESGNWVDTPVKTNVFCNIGSVSGAEFHRAGQSGFRPSAMVTMWKCDYSGQEEALINGEEMHIYRTYNQQSRAQHQSAANPDMIELYMEYKLKNGPSEDKA